jgi:putative salt-induced outer membrane protein YdiY
MRSLCLTLGAAALCLLWSGLRADEVLLKDGSRVVGEVQSLVDGKLKVKTAFAKEIEIAWPEVAGLTTEKTLPFVLKDGSIIMGRAAGGAAGNLTINMEQPAAPYTAPLPGITAINPPPKPAITFKGFAAAGATINDGNTQNKAFNGNAEFEARAERQRFTLRGSTNYAEDATGITARNSHGNLKYDFFVTKRFYLYASALFEGDKFQDLKLRTALSAGPGYQFIDTGTFQEPWLRELQVSGEAGLSYFNEDFGSSPDQHFVAARWSARVNWPIVPKKITLFHFHEGFPSLKRAADLYVTTEQGVRFAILENFFAAAQVNWRWDNTPAIGKERGDTAYLLSLGYNFEIATH